MSRSNRQQNKVPPKPAAAPLSNRVEIASMPKLEVKIQREPENEEQFQRTYGGKKPCTVFELWSLRIALLTLILTIGSIFVYVYQLAEMRKATEASIRAAKAAEDAVTKAQDSAHTDQRAWVGVRVGLKELAVDGVVTAIVEIFNVGKTPSVETEVIVYASVGGKKFDTYNEFIKGGIMATDSIASNSTIFPNGVSKTTVDCLVPSKLTAHNIDEIKNGSAIIQIGGEIRYRDIFGTAHFTNFFGVYTASQNGFDAYKDHNDAN